MILYVKNCIKAVMREDFQFENFKESLWCDIYLAMFKLLVGVCCRPPNSKDDRGVYEAIRKTSRVLITLMELCSLTMTLYFCIFVFSRSFECLFYPNGM